MTEQAAALEYRDIPGFPGYRVGSDGSVWSCRTKAGALKATWHRLRLSRRRKQRYVTACFRVGPKNHVRYVHRLVLELFVGPCPEGLEARHLNGIPFDNRVENLCWGTRLENVADRERHGTALVGSRHSMAKLTERDIPVILRLYELGVTQDMIGEAFGVSGAIVGNIVRGERWRHVPRPAELPDPEYKSGDPIAWEGMP